MARRIERSTQTLSMAPRERGSDADRSFNSRLIKDGAMAVFLYTTYGYESHLYHHKGSDYSLRVGLLGNPGL